MEITSNEIYFFCVIILFCQTTVADKTWDGCSSLPGAWYILIPRGPSESFVPSGGKFYRTGSGFKSIFWNRALLGSYVSSFIPKFRISIPLSYVLYQTKKQRNKFKVCLTVPSRGPYGEDKI